VTYCVEQIEVNSRILPVRFVLHRPRGRRYLLGPDIRRPDRLFVASVPPHPFSGRWFAVEGGKLVIAAPDA